MARLAQQTAEDRADRPAAGDKNSGRGDHLTTADRSAGLESGWLRSFVFLVR
jgi:hypothetical protein